MGPLRLLVLGAPRLERDGRPVELNLRRALALLVHLAVTDRAHARDGLAALLWPDADEREGRGRLRRTLHRLNEVLGDGVVVAEGESLRLSAQAELWVDSRAFYEYAAAGLAAAADGDPPSPAQVEFLERAAELYVDDFLAGFALADSPAWDEWQFLERERLRRACARVLGRLVRAHRDRGAYEAAIGYARRRLALDPLHEPAHRTLMALYALAGQHATALRQYQECARLLNAELGVAPEPKTIALCEGIKMRRLAPPTSAPATASATAGPTPESPDDRDALPGDNLARTDAPGEPAPRPRQEGDAPPDGPSHNLPIPLTAFVGRRADRREMLELLKADRSQPRLLTLTGAGGSGKTRLALEVAADLVPAYADGIWLVDLTALRDRSLVPRAVAATLGLRDEAGPAPIEMLARELGRKRLVLVLDNCEHLIDACAELADVLLRRCRHLKILATSRQALGIAGELIRPVLSLSLPEPRHSPPLDELAQYDAVQLFVDRAGLGHPDFRLTSQNAAGVTEICRRLDGMPLAIELAAARLRVLGVDQIMARLDDRFRLLTGGSRTALPRQQTLRGAIDWSYELLPEPERRLLCRLAVFAGGWTLDAAEAVCGTLGSGASGLESRVVAGSLDRGRQTPDVLDLLAGLAEKSLVAVEESDGQPRYRLLETIRQYAGERLVESGEAAAIERRHVDWFLALAERAASELAGPAQASWFELLEREQDNLRAALQWSIDHREAEIALRLSVALELFWVVRGHWGEGRRWCEQALALEPEAGGTLRPLGLSVAGYLARLQCDYARARALYEEALAVRRAAEDTSGIAWSLHDLGMLAWQLGDYARAGPLLDQALAIQREIGDRDGIAMTLRIVARVAYERGDDAAARVAAEEVLALFRALGNEHHAAHTLDFLGVLARGQGDHEQAMKLHQDGLHVFERIADKDGLAQARLHLGRLALDRGDWAGATALYVESLAARHQLGAPGDWPPHLEALAGAALAAGQPERAACLLGSAEALREATGLPLPPSEEAEHAATVSAARARLGTPAFDAAHATGRAMSLERTVSYALSSAPGKPAPDSSSPHNSSEALCEQHVTPAVPT